VRCPPIPIKASNVLEPIWCGSSARCVLWESGAGGCPDDSVPKVKVRRPTPNSAAACGIGQIAIFNFNNRLE
jgi:hypothetical protein